MNPCAHLSTAAIAAVAGAALACGTSETFERDDSLGEAASPAAAAVLGQYERLIPPAAGPGEQLRERDGHFVAATAARRLPRGRAELPRRATEPFHLVDESSGLDLWVAMLGAPTAPAEVVRGYVVYRSSVDTPTVLHRPSPFGTEDFIAFDRAPASERVVYAVTLGPGVRGLRSVGGPIEFVDGEGAPRLRVHAPYVVDREAQKHPATLSVIGCRVDDNPAAPWGRRPTPAGSDTCFLEVTWGRALGSTVRYPAVVDPGWTSTSAMANVRREHSASLLASQGKVLVAGGLSDADTATSTAELYDPTTGTWATTGALANARYRHTASVLQDGSVIAAGGVPYTQTTEVYDPASGAWTLASPMTAYRYQHTSTVLSNGKVLVAGGITAGVGAVASAELYSPTSTLWSATGSMPVAKQWAAAALLPDGRVLVTGGSDQQTENAVPSTALYDPATGTWSAGPAMNDARMYHTATELLDGRVLISGGYAATIYLKAAELYDPATNSFQQAASMLAAHESHGAALLPGGSVLVAGGIDQGVVTSAAEVWDPGNDAWTDAGSMLTARAYFTMTALGDGTALVAGGQSAAVASLNVAEIYDPGTATGGGAAGGGGAGGGAGQGGATTATSGAGPSGTGGTGTACAPGQQVGCACPGGDDGVQVCKDDGSGFGSCTGCSADSAGAGGESSSGEGDDGGCGCRVAGADSEPSPWWLVAALPGVAILRRPRRRDRSRR